MPNALINMLFLRPVFAGTLWTVRSKQPGPRGVAFGGAKRGGGGGGGGAGGGGGGAHAAAAGH